MKNRFKKTAALCLALLMALSCFASLQAFAAETFTAHATEINPIYAHVYPNGVPQQAESDVHGGPQKGPQKAAKQRFTSVDAVGDYVRERMKARETDASFTLVVSANSFSARTQAQFNAYAREKVAQIMEKAVKHTGNGKEGDYLRYVYGYWEMGAGLAYNYVKREYEFETSLSIGYYTTAAQEAQVDTALAALYPTLALQGKTAFEKIKTIYDYLCETVSYDTAHVYDDDYLPQYTAHAALIDHTAVCQGYASLFYRMALDNGLDARVIGGTAGGEGHAWNIVKLGSVYYNLDSTWDSELPAYLFFLKSEESFADHKRDSDYLTSEFQSAYPMAQSNYDVSGLNDPALWTGAAAATFSRGSGTAGDPYQIGSAEELALLAKHVGNGNRAYAAACYCLTADLDLSGKSWVPIGYLLVQGEEGIYEIPPYTFSGSFDGNGHTIKNMTVSQLPPNCGYIGLFGALRGTVRNLVLENPEISLADTETQRSDAQMFVGALAGDCDVNPETMQRAEVEECLVQNAQIHVQTQKALVCAAFAGLLGESKVWNCFATGSTTAESGNYAIAGGFAGVMFSGAGVYLCGFDGSVSAKGTGAAQAEEEALLPAAAAGGFTGSVIGQVTVKNCKAEGTVAAQAEQNPAVAGAFIASAKNLGGSSVCKNLLADCDVLRSDPAGEQTEALFCGASPEAQTDEAPGDWAFNACVNRNQNDFVVLKQTPGNKTETIYALHDEGLQTVFSTFPAEYWETGENELPALRLQKRLQCIHQYGAGTVVLPSCLQYGKTVYVCDLCGHSRADSVTVNASHSDANADGRCDVCGAVMQTQSGDANICPYCGDPHTGFFAPLVYWFHSLLYYIFGAKK